MIEHKVKLFYTFKQKKPNIMVIRGYGVYAYSRDMHEMAKKTLPS